MPSSDACLVFGNAWASEGIDRPGLSDTYTDTLVKKAASQCNNTMVVLHNAGPRLLDEFADHPNVTAILMAHLPGRESGTALVKLLYGEASPSGKLPYTLARNASVYGHLLNPDEPARRFQNFSQSDFSIYRGRSRRAQVEVEVEVEVAIPASGPIVPGGQADLFDTIAQGSVRVRNTGKMAGAEVQQLAQVAGRRISHRKGNERLTVVDDDGLARATDPTC
ncbi:hypothetical protein E4U37_003549 [Claviceps purpurea]|nr:hypothetical protein E4U37_003549 [Claviceps purpurea]